MFKSIRKRDGRLVDFNEANIISAIAKAGAATGEFTDDKTAETLSDRALKYLQENMTVKIPSVEMIQDAVETVLMNSNHKKTAKSYILYRQERNRIRNSKSRLMSQYQIITGAMAKDSSDLKRSNANVDGDTAMGKMLQYGAEGAKEFAKSFLIKPSHAAAHEHGEIHIHDLDFLATGTLTCCQIDPLQLFADGGFSTGHGTLRTPNAVGSYGALAAIILQANQNEQHGGQSIPNFDFMMADGVNKTYRKMVKQNAEKFTEFTGKKTKINEDKLASLNYDERMKGYDQRIFDLARKDTIKQTYQSMEALVHNLNTMHSRAGAQVPFTSLNFGTDVSPAGLLATEQFLLAAEAGLGRGETPIFPISVYKVKEGVNYNPEDPGYAVFQLAMRVSAKRLFPNFSFLDAPFNAKYYKPGDYSSEVAYMGCRTRVLASVHPESDGCSIGRGNCSFTTINLPRIAIKHGIATGEREDADWKGFFRELDERLDTAAAQLRERFDFQGNKTVKNFPFLMGQDVWFGSGKLKPNDKLREVIKHGTLSLGFIGLAESLVAMTGKHHGEDEETQRLGIEIITRMRERIDKMMQRQKLNYTLLATPAEGIAGRFTKLDREEFGVIPGVTDREYYTNSYHVPVYYTIGAFDKIEKEAPYHTLCNAGHITYVELDGDPTKNLAAFEALIRHMKESGIGYGSVNHPVDRDPVCGFTGIIDNGTCPSCGRDEQDGDATFERIRRITGYLAGSVERWNDAKKAEEKSRIRHDVKKSGISKVIDRKDEQEAKKRSAKKAIGKV